MGISPKNTKIHGISGSSGQIIFFYIFQLWIWILHKDMHLPDEKKRRVTVKKMAIRPFQSLKNGISGPFSRAVSIFILQGCKGP